MSCAVGLALCAAIDPAASNPETPIPLSFKLPSLSNIAILLLVAFSTLSTLSLSQIAILSNVSLD